MIFIRNPGSGLFLTLNGTVCGNQTALTVDQNQTNAWQRWVMKQDNTIESWHCPGMVIGIQGSHCTNGAVIHVAPKTVSLDYQVWARREDGVIWNANCTTQGMDIRNGWATPGQGIILWGIHGGANQRWVMDIAPTMSPTKSPIKSPTVFPTSLTMSPSVSRTCFPRASKVKLQSITGLHIQVFEVEVYSSGHNVAAGKITTQSTLYNDSPRYAASLAVDGKSTTFSHTNSLDKAPWWMVDLGEMFPIESIVILNRWCGNLSDPNECLCRLSHSSVALFDDQHNWVYATYVGDMCGVRMYENNMTKSIDNCSE